MKRVLFFAGLVVMLTAFGFFGYELVTNPSPHPLHIYMIGGAFSVGAILSALMADPTALLGLLDRVSQFKRGGTPS